MKKAIITIVLGLAVVPLFGQSTPLTTPAANFLSITPDARSAGMGNTGVAVTGAGAYSFFHNPASGLLSGNDGAVAYTFSPWMRDISSGYSLNSMGGMYNIAKRHSIMAGFRLFSNPSADITDDQGNRNGTFKPKETAIDLGYGYLITDNLSVGFTGRYISSKTVPDESGSAVAFSIGAMYKKEIGSMDGANWALGLNVANIGSKVKYSDKKYDLPGIAKLGGSLNLPFSSAHKLMLALDLGYRLPSDVSGINGGFGAEYGIVNHVFIRAGYHFGDKDKGDESYATTGLGLNFYGAHLDFSYLMAGSDSPLKNTFSLSVGFQF